MLNFMQRVIKRRDDKGASAVEYGLLVAAIAAIIVVIVFALGTLVNDTFKGTCSKIKEKATTVTTTSDCGTPPAAAETDSP